MGYSYDWKGRLACDHCGAAEGKTRRRTCTKRVTTSRHKMAGGTRASLPYCYPSALCPACYKTLGGARAIHAGCTEGAAKRQAYYDAQEATLVAGGLLVSAAWGAWHATVPAGSVGVLFEGLAGAKAYRLVPESAYDGHADESLAAFEARLGSDLRSWDGPDAAVA